MASISDIINSAPWRDFEAFMEPQTRLGVRVRIEALAESEFSAIPEPGPEASLPACPKFFKLLSPTARRVDSDEQEGVPAGAVSGRGHRFRCGRFGRLD
jgi:hypothetical protein